MRNHFIFIDENRSVPTGFERSNGIYNQLRPVEAFLKAEFQRVIKHRELRGHDLWMDVTFKGGRQTSVVFSFQQIIRYNLSDSLNLFEFFQDGFLCANHSCVRYFSYSEIEHLCVTLTDITSLEIESAMEDREEELEKERRLYGAE